LLFLVFIIAEPEKRQACARAIPHIYNIAHRIIPQRISNGTTDKPAVQRRKITNYFAKHQTF
jgi:hypothetical protein